MKSYRSKRKNLFAGFIVLFFGILSAAILHRPETKITVKVSGPTSSVRAFFIVNDEEQKTEIVTLPATFHFKGHDLAFNFDFIKGSLRDTNAWHVAVILGDDNSQTYFDYTFSGKGTHGGIIVPNSLGLFGEKWSGGI
mgnify:CR=1 FL=1